MIDERWDKVVWICNTRIKVLPEDVVLDPSATADKRASGSLVDQSESMRPLFSMIEDVAALKSSVIIEGETGTGKELTSTS